MSELKVEDVKELENIIAVLEAEGYVYDHGRWTKHPMSIRSTKIVKFLLKKRMATSVTEALDIGQRLLAANQIIPCEQANIKSRFTNTKKLYYLSKNVMPLKEEIQSFTKGSRFHITSQRDSVLGTLHIQGPRVIKGFGILDTEAPKLYHFRSPNDKKPCYIYDLTEALYHIELAESRQEASVMKPSPKLVGLNPDAKQMQETLPHWPHAFLHISTPHITVPFRLETDVDVTKWSTALNSAKVPMMTPSQIKDTLGSDTVLDLRDVLNTPEFRKEFLKFLEEQFAVENLKFIEAVDGYKQVNDHGERHLLAQQIFHLFVDDKAPEMINLDSKTRENLIAKYNQHLYRKNLFDSAYEVIYVMMERDVYMRFVQSSAYNNMITIASSRHRKVSTNTRGSPSPLPGRSISKHDSFIIPSVENLTELKSVKEAVSKSDIVKDHRSMFQKYPRSFRGHDLVDFLIAHSFARIRPAGEALGQRLIDASIMRHVKNCASFADCDELYTFEPDTAMKSEKGCMDKIAELEDEQRSYVCSTLLLKTSIRYSRVFALYDPKKRKFYVYRSKQATRPILIRSIKQGEAKFSSREGVNINAESRSESPQHMDLNLPQRIVKRGSITSAADAARPPVRFMSVGSAPSNRPSFTPSTSSNGPSSRHGHKLTAFSISGMGNELVIPTSRHVSNADTTPPSEVSYMDVEDLCFRIPQPVDAVRWKYILSKPKDSTL